MYYCFHPCCQWFQNRVQLPTTLCRNWMLEGLKAQGFGVRVPNPLALGRKWGGEPVQRVWHCAWQTLIQSADAYVWQQSIQLDNKYQIPQDNGTGSQGQGTNYNLFCSVWKTCLDGDQHVHTLSHTPYNNTPSLSVDVAFRRLWRVGRRRKLPYHKRPWDIHLKFSIILFIRGWVSQSWGSQSNFSL